MISTSRCCRLVLLTCCVIANVLVGFYAIPTLLVLTGLGDDNTSSRLPPSSTSTIVLGTASFTLRTSGEDGTRHGRKYDELTYGYALEPPDAAHGRYCNHLSPEKQTLLIIVCSAVENIDRRKAIRSTWGDTELLTAAGVRLAFVVARTDPGRSPPGIERRVAAEYRHQGDVIQADFIDDYVNLTAKTVAALRWAVRACPRVGYVMKSDDDVYVDVAALTRRLERERTTQISTFGVDAAAASAFIMGQVVDSARPVRDRRSRWYTPTSIYPAEFYPPYTSGTGYVLGASVVRRLVSLIDAKSSVFRPFWLEDVYVTGMLATGLPDVRLVHDGRFNFRPTMRRMTGRRRRTSRTDDEEACAYRDAITVHDLTPTELVSLWNRLRPPSSRCTDDELEYEPEDSEDNDERLYSNT